MLRTIRLISALALATLAVSPPTRTISVQAQQGGQGAGVRAAAGNSFYIVQMSELPVGSYTGGVPGFPATKAPRGAKLDPNAPNVVGYAGFLASRHDEALGRAGGRKIYDYRYSFNGFAAELSEAQAEALRSAPGVLAVTKDELVNGDTSRTPTFLGLDQPGGLWEQAGGIGDAGEDVIVGIIDSGIWPENQSFSDRTGSNGNGKQGGKLSYQQVPGWHGKCTPGELFPASKCNQKVIGAQRFNEAWGGDAGLKEERPWEFASPRDYNGHGSHTASTAAGNNAVQLTGPAAAFGSMSGIAPRARIAVYKALWSLEDGSQASGFVSDLVAAIDQAVADGVDVINYSISGTTTNFLDPVEVAFLFAADAGVFVAASAGNAGPTTGTVAHPSPWITTVAAGTHDRSGEGAVRLGNGQRFTGASLATAVGPAPFIDAAVAGLTGASASEAALCFSASLVNNGAPVLDPAKVAGKIVLCDRGTNARVDKSLAVRNAGGIGMVLVNVVPGTIDPDFHYIPSVHVADTARPTLKAYAATAGATATIEQSTIVFNRPAPLTAAFSSRGPLTAGAGDLLKPDVIAPGQDIVAAVAPPSNGGFLYNVYSGTSMSSPHVAGLAALLRDVHPDWSPMMIKSALMTTAGDVLDGPNTNPLVIFRQGGGHVRPNLASDPGLVYDSNANDWFAFLCGTTTGVTPAVCAALASSGYSLDPSDLNVASIAIGSLVGTQTVRRRVTNVGAGTSTYTPTVSGLAGFTASATPTSLTLAAGQSAVYTLTITRTTAALNTYAGGQLTWSDGTHNVRIPIVARPVALAAPATVFGTGGPLSYDVTFGYTGTFTATPRGLTGATTTDGTVADDPADSFAPTGPGVVSFPMTIAAGTTYARFSLFNANVSPASDIDIYVYRTTATGPVLVAVSAGGTSQEEANVLNPPAGDYTVYVHGFEVPGTANFRLFSWLLGSTSAGNMAVTAPASATLGTTGTINLTFSGLTAGTKYLGSVAYGGTAGLPNPTIVRVDP